MKFQTTLVSLCTVLSLSTLSSALADTDVYAPFPAPSDECVIPDNTSSADTISKYCGSSSDLYAEGCYMTYYAIPGCEVIKEYFMPGLTCNTATIYASSLDAKTSCTQQKTYCDAMSALPGFSYPDMDCDAIYDSCINSINAFDDYCING